MPAKSAPSLIRTPDQPPAASRSSFTHHPARTHPSCTRTKSSINALTPSLLHVTLAYSSGINAPASDTMPEDCSRGCSIRSGPETVRQSPCMAPGSLIIRLHSRLLRHARTANGSFCAPSACPVLPIGRGSRTSQVHFRLRQTSDCRPSWTSIRLVWTAQRRSIAILKAAVSALSTPEPAPAYPPPLAGTAAQKKTQRSLPGFVMMLQSGGALAML